MLLETACLVGFLFACGTFLILRRSFVQILFGFVILGNAANLFLLIVMGRPGVAPFYGAADPSEMSDPLPQALTLTAIVITFAVSAFLLALIYRSWQLGQADTVHDDEADLAVRARTEVDEEQMDDETSIEDEYDDATTDFIGTDTAPITVLHHRDLEGIRDDAPTDRPGASAGESRDRDGGEAR